MVEKKQKRHRFVRISRVRAYLLLKAIKRRLREQERKVKIRV